MQVWQRWSVGKVERREHCGHVTGQRWLDGLASRQMVQPGAQSEPTLGASRRIHDDAPAGESSALWRVHLNSSATGTNRHWREQPGRGYNTNKAVSFAMVVGTKRGNLSCKWVTVVTPYIREIHLGPVADVATEQNYTTSSEAPPPIPTVRSHSLFSEHPRLIFACRQQLQAQAGLHQSKNR
jgi:hypothetical protein